VKLENSGGTQKIYLRNLITVILDGTMMYFHREYESLKEKRKSKNGKYIKYLKNIKYEI